MKQPALMKIVTKQTFKISGNSLKSIQQVKKYFWGKSAKSQNSDYL
jgi:hypothetical protein